MARVTRRKFLKVSGAGALAAKAGGMAGILATGRAPAYAQATTLHWLRWNDFVPASDQLLRKEILPEAEKALGFKINLETVNGNDLQPRITAAIQSGSGPDLIMLFNNHPQLYAASLVDMSDVAEAVGKAEGGYYPLVKSNSNDGKKWISMPWTIVGGMIAYRKSWFEEVGSPQFPDTWEKYHEVGKKLKAKGRPIGQTLGHTFGDAPTFSYPLMWSFGGKEVDAERQGGHQQQGDHRLRQVHDRLLEGRARRGRSRLGRHQQQPRVPLADDCGHAQRRLDLHRIAAQPRQVHHREGRAAEDRHPARGPAQGSGRTVLNAHLLLARAAEATPRTRRRPRTS